MSELSEAKVTEVQRLTLKLGDALAVKVDRRLKPSDVNHIRAIIGEELPGISVLILEPGIELEVVETPCQLTS